MSWSFANPWALVALAAIPVIIGLWLRARRGGAVLYSATARAAAANLGLRSRLAFVPAAARAAALTALVVAIARPQEISGTAQTSTQGIAIQLVVDRSGSMDEPAMIDGRRVTRLEAVKQVVAEFVAGDGDSLAGRKGDLLGLIAFGSFADTLCPLVSSHDLLLGRLASIEIPTLQSERGTAIGDALMLAAARLKSVEEALTKAQRDLGNDDFSLSGKAIVLLTDGENTQGTYSPKNAAGLAAQWGIRVYVIGIRGGVTQSFGGIRISAGQAVNERQLAEVAESTGGKFWAVDQLDQLRGVYAEIDRLEKTDIQISEYTQYDEQFVGWALAALILVIGECLLRATVLRRLP